MKIPPTVRASFGHFPLQPYHSNEMSPLNELHSPGEEISTLASPSKGAVQNQLASDEPHTSLVKQSLPRAFAQGVERPENAAFVLVSSKEPSFFCRKRAAYAHHEKDDEDALYPGSSKLQNPTKGSPHASSLRDVTDSRPSKKKRCRRRKAPRTLVEAPRLQEGTEQGVLDDSEYDSSDHLNCGDECELCTLSKLIQKAQGLIEDSRRRRELYANLVPILAERTNPEVTSESSSVSGLAGSD